MISFKNVNAFISINKLKIIITLLLIFTTIAVYSQVINFDFVSFDDDLYVYNNQQAKDGLTFQNIVWCFKTTHAYNWHPLTWISLFLDSSLFGASPEAYHLTNLFFHIVNSLLLLLVLTKMTKDFWRSIFVAALFALHPLHVESVAWISERKDVLSTFFWMLTMLSYSLYVSSPKGRRYVLVMLFLVLSLLAKPMAVTLPFVLLLVDYWPLRRYHFSKLSKGHASYKTKQKGYNEQEGSILNIIGEKLPLFTIVVIVSIVTLFCSKRQWNGSGQCSYRYKNYQCYYILCYLYKKYILALQSCRFLSSS
jgi:hypothetical protein